MLTLPTHPLSYYTYQFWAVAWYAGTKAAASGPLGEKDAGDKTGPLGMMYSLLLSFLAEDSFDQAVLRSDELRGSAAEMHSTRLSATSHYGIGRHALHYLLRGWDVSHEDCKKISLLLRMQMLELAQHDLGVVRYVSSAEPAAEPRFIVRVRGSLLVGAAVELQRETEEWPSHRR